MSATTGRSGISRPALAGWATFVLLVLYAVLVGGGFAGIYLDSLRTASLAITAVGLLGWFVLSARDARWRPSTAIWPTLVLPLVALALGTLASERPRLGLEYVAWAVVLVGLYLLLVRVLATRTARDRIGALAAMLSLVIGVLYIVTVVQAWLEWWDLIGEFAVPPLRPLYASLSLGGPGTVQTVQVLTTVIAVAGLGLAGRRRQLLAAVLIGLTAVVTILAASRTGWGALALALALTSALWVVLAARSGSVRERISARWAQRGTRIALGGAIAGILIGLIVVAPVISDRLMNSGTGGRGQYFTVALRMFADRPLLGHGPGTWAVERVSYTQPGELDYYIPHAHDIYLQTLAELGLVGAFLGLLALAPLAWLVWRALGSDAAETRRWAWGAVFVLLFLAFFNVLDFQMNVPAVFVLGAVPIAWLDASSREGIGLGSVGESVGRWAGPIARSALWLGCLAAIIVLARAESAAITHRDAVERVYAADWGPAHDLAAKAQAADHDYPAYAITLGLVASAQGDWETAEEAYRFAADADDMSQSWLGLAQAQEALGAADSEVIESIERALRIGVQQPSVVFAAGALYDRLGLPDRADELYADALATYPSLAADAYWQREDDIAARFDGIVASAIQQAPDRAWEVALMAGDDALARELTAGNETSETIAEAWGGDSSALEKLYARADEAADSPSVLAWASRLALRGGEDERAARYRRLAVFDVFEGGELPGTEIRIDGDGYLDAVPAGTNVEYAGQYLYRRPLPIDLLPPGLPRLVFAPH